MSKFKHYKLNPETLLYELKDVSMKRRFLGPAIVFLGSIVVAVLYFWIYASVLGLESPKMAILKKQNAAWVSRMELMNHQMDGYATTLDGLEMRNDNIYRSIFGMSAIPQDAGLGSSFSPEQRTALDALPASSLLRTTAERLDALTRAVYFQSKSFDEVATLSKRAGDMASCIPYIMPINPGKPYRFTSPFGYRSDPVYGRTKFHEGNDFAMPSGNPVFATGDGVVEAVNFNFFGYGNEVLINHGFGYRTRYAHLSVVNVVEGMKLKRGDCIGETGNSGKSTGPHLHYEVHYKGQPVNPANFYDPDMTREEYEAMVNMRDSQSQEVLRTSRRTVRRRR